MNRERKILISKYGLGLGLFCPRIKYPYPPPFADRRCFAQLSTHIPWRLLRLHRSSEASIRTGKCGTITKGSSCPHYLQRSERLVLKASQIAKHIHVQIGVSHAKMYDTTALILTSKSLTLSSISSSDSPLNLSVSVLASRQLKRCQVLLHQPSIWSRTKRW